MSIPTNIPVKVLRYNSQQIPLYTGVTPVEHPNPTISVNLSSGVISASHTQPQGYVSGGTSTSTYQLQIYDGSVS